MNQDSSAGRQLQSSFAALRRFVRERAPVEHCELCGAVLASDHPHLVEPASRKLVCACDPCAILFTGHDRRNEKNMPGGQKYRRVPRRIRFLPDFRLTDAQWDGLMIPINMAFFFHSSPAGKVVALYPSPAGPMESLLTFASWKEIVAENPILKKMEPDVEALLVSRVGSRRGQASDEYYLVPIDECYKLTGLIRAHWRGLSGGAEAWDEIARFFSGLKERALTNREASCA
jgi:hypothetical protein